MKSWNRFLAENDTKTSGIVVCLNDEQQFLIIRRSDVDEREGQWTMPGGHIDEEDRSIEAGAVRELEEEANLRCEISDLTYLGEPKPQKYVFLTQKWSGEINIDKPNPESGKIEHDDWKWSTIEDIKEIENTEIPIYLLEKALEISKNETTN
tara:strand:+ start:871 stop:1326 length:456 start_codon:yes stop_codon:yes gene_type:complete